MDHPDLTVANSIMEYSIGLQLDKKLSNSYTMACPPVRGDNPRALASGLSYVQSRILCPRYSWTNMV